MAGLGMRGGGIDAFNPLSLEAQSPYNSAFSVSRKLREAFHESAVVPQVRKETSS